MRQLGGITAIRPEQALPSRGSLTELDRHLLEPAPPA
jgi:hypothetical protein